jgi:hypothetical protein
MRILLVVFRHGFHLRYWSLSSRLWSTVVNPSRWSGNIALPWVGLLTRPNLPNCSFF